MILSRLPATVVDGRLRSHLVYVLVKLQQVALLYFFNDVIVVDCSLSALRLWSGWNKRFKLKFSGFKDDRRCMGFS